MLMVVVTDVRFREVVQNLHKKEVFAKLMVVAIDVRFREVVQNGTKRRALRRSWLTLQRQLQTKTTQRESANQWRQVVSAMPVAYRATNRTNVSYKALGRALNHASRFPLLVSQSA